MPQFQDKEIECQDCGVQFTWDASEQAYFAKKGFKETPRRCRACRAKKKIQQQIEKDKEKEIVCAFCSKKAVTAANISTDSEILCLDCFVKKQMERPKKEEESADNDDSVDE